MAGTLEGGRRTRAKLLAKDPDYYKKLGAKGGSAPTKYPKGFAAMPREKVSAAGKKGGAISRRGKKSSKMETAWVQDQTLSNDSSSSMNTKTITAKCRSCLFVKRDVNSDGLCPRCADFDQAVDGSLIPLLDETDRFDLDTDEGGIRRFLRGLRR